MSTDKDRKDDKREHILDAAEALFAEHGFQATSTRMLASAASVNLGMLTYYFGCKEKIFEELIDRRMGFWQKSHSAVIRDGRDYWETLEEIISIYTSQYVRNKHFYQILHKEIWHGTHTQFKEFAIGVITNKNHEMLRFFTNGIRDKAFREDIDIPFLMSCFYGTLFNVLKPESMQIRSRMMNEDKDVLSDDAMEARLSRFLNQIMTCYLKN